VEGRRRINFGVSSVASKYEMTMTESLQHIADGRVRAGLRRAGGLREIPL